MIASNAASKTSGTAVQAISIADRERLPEGADHQRHMLVAHAPPRMASAIRYVAWKAVAIVRAP